MAWEGCDHAGDDTASALAAARTPVNARFFTAVIGLPLRRGRRNGGRIRGGAGPGKFVFGGVARLCETHGRPTTRTDVEQFYGLGGSLSRLAVRLVRSDQPGRRRRFGRHPRDPFEPGGR